KYHPHGDSAVYYAMVRLAQNFSTRYPLVDGHGNFGSVDGDGAAAMRYTEAKMSKITNEMLRDIGKNTIDYKPNFDEELEEPIVLPSRFPNLLVNGTNGIAVGMATSIPPHNLNEVIDAVVMLIDNPEAELKDLMTKIKGPDFPTGATITGKEAIKEAYRTGRGKVKVRAKTTIEPMKNNKNRILVTEIPYQVNKARLIEKIAHLVRDKKLEGISDLRDESDRNGMRIVIELKRDANPNIVLNNLYKHTQMQDTYSLIMIALVNNEPKVLTLKEILEHYLEHQREVITRRTQYELDKAQARAHILEGIKIALDHIDEVIKLIRASKNGPEAKEGLISKFGLSEIQAQAILDMRLQKLTGLERDKIDEEYSALIKEINRLTEILANERLIYKIVKDEIIEIRDKYGDERRTEIVNSVDEINIADMIEEENIVITLTHFGYIKRLPEDTYKIQHRGGRGVTGLTTRDEDFVEDMIITSTHDNLLFFTSKGKVYTLKAFQIPEAKRQAKGTAVVNLLQLEAGETIKAIIPIKEFKEENYLIFSTQKGLVKKTNITQFESIRKSGLIAINLKDGDELISVKKTNGGSDIIVTTIFGMSIRFNEKDVRDMGRGAMGVKAINLNRSDKVISMNLVEEGTDLLVISEQGFGKRTNLDEYRTQTRGGKGIKTYNIKAHTGDLIGARVVNKEDEIMIISYLGIIIRLNIAGISQMGRTTQGVKIMKVGKDDRVVSIAKVMNEEEMEKIEETEES
ncbi:DNA gyrase subunit A, partial [Senegalia sp. (in: firmicutes)]|uniref:DNA gyrase subunit A n=1 Tax=Senegalia sp. (in: firmicutes) TaxID=1924098 RepID=UPI003F9BF4D9